jgi:3-oxoacid CoA-transferase
MASKVFDSFAAAVADVPDEASILISGFTEPGTPHNLIRALWEQGAKDLTIIANTANGSGQEQLVNVARLVAERRVRKVILAFTAGTHPSRPNVLEMLHEAGEIEAEIVAQGTLAERMRAAGAGIPAFFTPAAIGTELAAGREQRVFNGRPYLMEEALSADYAFIRAWKCDGFGNTKYRLAQRNFGPLMAMAARHTIIEAEELAATGSIEADEVHTPGIFVERVVPIGANDILRVTRNASLPDGAYASASQRAEEHSGAKPRLPRELMAARIAAEFQPGWLANLGVGMPTLCSDFIPAGQNIVLHSENGVIGYGRLAGEGEEDPFAVNAGGQHVVLEPYASIVRHDDSFAVVRKGLLDVAVLGAYEVGANGDLANWKLAGRKGGGIGGAMDIAACAQRVFVMMEHTTRSGGGRLLVNCTLPITAPACVKLVMTDLGLFEPAGDHFVLHEIAPDWTIEEVQALTGAPVKAADGLREVAF